MSSTHTDIPLSPPLNPPSRRDPLREVSSAPAARGDRRIWWLPIVAVVGLLAVLTAGAFGLRHLLAPDEGRDIQFFTVVPRSFAVTFEERGELQAAHSIDIRSELEGRATIIYLVEEGTMVEEGDLLVELASDQIDDMIREAEISVATATAAYEAAVNEFEILRDENASNIRRGELDVRMAEMNLEKYTSGEAVELRQTAKLAHDRATSVLERNQERLKDSEGLYEQGYLTRVDLEDDRFSAYEARIELQKAELALEVLEKYTIPMDLQERESDLAEARMELDRVRKSAMAAEAKAAADLEARKSELALRQDKLNRLVEQKAKSRITAPAAGMVVYARQQQWWRSERLVEEGGEVHERQSLIELPDTSRMKVVIRVHEARIEQLQRDMPAVIEIEGVGGRRFQGKVSRIAVLADSQNRRLNPNLKQYETDVMLHGEFTDLKPGLSARVQVIVAELEDVLAVPVQTVFARGGRHYVFVQRGDEIEPRQVKVGLSSSEFVEIRSGLEAGEIVRLTVSDEMRLMLPQNDRNNAMPPANAPMEAVAGT